VQTSEAVVRKRVPLGLPMHKFLIPGRKFSPGKNRGDAWNEKKLKFLIFFYSTQKKRTARLF